jgi:hypothetical protein
MGGFATQDRFRRDFGSQGSIQAGGGRMEAARRVYTGNLDYESLWGRLADKAMGIRRKKSTADYEQTAWQLIQPLLAEGWHTHAKLKEITGRHVFTALKTHRGELRKRGINERTQYRLKAKP